MDTQTALHFSKDEKVRLDVRPIADCTRVEISTTLPGTDIPMYGGVHIYMAEAQFYTLADAFSRYAQAMLHDIDELTAQRQAAEIHNAQEKVRKAMAADCCGAIGCTNTAEDGSDYCADHAELGAEQ